jgi:hypothetical protein
MFPPGCRIASDSLASTLLCVAPPLRRDVRTPEYALVAEPELVSTILQRRYDTMLGGSAVLCRLCDLLPSSCLGDHPFAVAVEVALDRQVSVSRTLPGHTMLLLRST